MKKIAIILLLALVTLTSAKVVSTKSKVPVALKEAVIAYYKNLYGATEVEEELWIEVNGEYSQLITDPHPLKGDVTDTTLSLVFRNSGWLGSVSFNHHEKRFMYGDMDANDEDDLVLILAVEGGGAGANGAVYSDVLVMLNYKKNSYRVTCSATDYQLRSCEDAGYFVPKRIVDGGIAGKNYCFQEGDSRWEPTLVSDARVNLEGDSLVVGE